MGRKVAAQRYICLLARLVENREFIRCTKWGDLFPRNHHVRFFEKPQSAIFFLNQSWREMNLSFGCDPSLEV